MAEELKNWEDYRIEEMEKKADVEDLPEFDMDGSRYNPFDGEDDYSASDAYFESISMTLSLRLGNVHPMEYDEHRFLRWSKAIEISTGYTVHDLIEMRLDPYGSFKGGMRAGDFIRTFELRREA